MNAASPSPPGDRPPFPGVIVRQWEPENLEFPFASLAGPITPVEQFYVRSHFPLPRLTAADWRLDVGGAVAQTFSLTYDELLALPAVTRAVTLECAGNGRIFLVPPVSGAQWETGAVSTAEWTGVPLSRVLARAGLRPEAVEVVLEGADKGKAKEPPVPPGEFHYARGLPVVGGPLDEVLLAYRMNGRPLPPSHGFPVRAIVPGWYGMASVKWLVGIHVLDHPFAGYFQTVDYAHWRRDEAGRPVRVPITAMRPKAQIARPAQREAVPVGVPYRVTGAAWTGGGAEVAKVEVSTDGGHTYAAAELVGALVRHAWRQWSFAWTPPAPGPVTLMARATDTAGRTQPADRDPDLANYVVCHTLPVAVTVTVGLNVAVVPWHGLPVHAVGGSPTGRDHFVEQSSPLLAVRQGNWKLIPPGPRRRLAVLEEGDTTEGPRLTPDGQLFDLSPDPGESHNVIAEHPDVARKLTALLQHDREAKAMR